MRITVDSMIRLPELPPRAAAALRRRLSFPNPEYEAAVRFGRHVGAIPEEIVLVEHVPYGGLNVPRGAVGAVREVLTACGLTIEFIDHRALLPPLDLTLRLQLRDYQERAVAALARRVQGCAVLPCGAGKTVVGAGVIARLRQPALVLVHTRDLLAQWRERLREALGVEAGTVGEGVVAPADVTVAMVQTLTSMPLTEVAALGERFGTVILDEAHHAGAVIFRTLLGALPGRYRFGLTATPTREDGLTPLLELCIGPVAFAMGHDELVRAGHLVVPEVRALETECAPPVERYADLISALVRNEHRNQTIADTAVEAARAGHLVLVLSARVDHCHRLAALIREHEVAGEALTGGLPRQKRHDRLEAFRSGEVRVVCATSLADEGLDVPNLSRLILATPARAQGRTIQRLGRLMRPHPGKGTPVLIDVVDAHPLARKQFAARQRAYRKVLGRHACRGHRSHPEGMHGIPTR